MPSNSHSCFVIACFCAAWCRTCDDYVRVFDLLKKNYAEHAEVVWVDIEDQAELLDDVDVENFPTLLVSDRQQVYFWGTVLPHVSTATQLIDRVMSGATGGIDAPDILALNQRLRSYFFS